ncbi:acetylglutamate semialdehyde dehydrogenase [Priestia sp. HNGD-A6]|uniref:acetylglutamate semialdehyde dehydrogenase n=1 Tax=Priestia sp. HNGD-A6 TaxID=3092666 RepID=UPI003891EEBA
MNNIGFSPKQLLLEMYETDEKRFREITRLDDKEKSKYRELLTHLKRVHEEDKEAKKKKIKSPYTTNDKGKALEELVSFLLEKSSVFEVYQNIRNSTNEVDQLLILNHKGKKFKEFLNLPGYIYLSECKNYNKKVSVTWVGKFFSLLISNKSRIGFLFSYHGFAGSSWNSAVGLVKKLFLTKEEINQRTYIIDINLKDFEKIEEGYSLLEIIDAKMKAIRLDTNFEKFLELKHPAQE